MVVNGNCQCGHGTKRTLGMRKEQAGGGRSPLASVARQDKKDPIVSINTQNHFTLMYDINCMVKTLGPSQTCGTLLTPVRASNASNALMALDGRLTPLDVIIAKIPTWLPEKPETRPTVLLAPEQVKYVVSEAVVSVETFHRNESVETFHKKESEGYGNVARVMGTH